MSFTLFQFTNLTKDIFHLNFPIFKIPRLLTIGNPVKTLSIWARLWSDLTQSSNLQTWHFSLEYKILPTQLINNIWNGQNEQFSDVYSNSKLMHNCLWQSGIVHIVMKRESTVVPEFPLKPTKLCVWRELGPIARPLESDRWEVLVPPVTGCQGPTVDQAETRD